MTPEQVQKKYQSFDYRIRYLSQGVTPLTAPEPGAVYAVECDEMRLLSEPSGKPWLFATEAEAFATRETLGISFPVLVFSEREPAVADAQMENAEHLDRAVLASVDAYADGVA